MIVLCEVEKCERPKRVGRKHFCHMHLSRFYRTGSLEEPAFSKNKLCRKCEKRFVDTDKAYRKMYCPDCHKKRYQLYGPSRWNSSPEGKVYGQKYALEYKEKFKKIVYDHYGWTCNCCKETTEAFLTIDHVNNDGHSDRINGRKLGGVSLHKKIIKENFPDKYQILCMNCNWGKKIKDGICPHQT